MGRMAGGSQPKQGFGTWQTRDTEEIKLRHRTKLYLMHTASELGLQTTHQ